MSSTTSVDLSEFVAENKIQGPRCGVAIVLTKLDAAQAAKLTAAIDSPMDVIQHSAIERTVQKWGHRLSRDTVKRHRFKACACAR